MFHSGWGVWGNTVNRWTFNDYAHYTNLGAKRAKRSVKMGTTCFYRVFSKIFCCTQTVGSQKLVHYICNLQGFRDFLPWAVFNLFIVVYQVSVMFLGCKWRKGLIFCSKICSNARKNEESNAGRHSGQSSKPCRNWTNSKALSKVKYLTGHTFLKH